MLVECFLLPPFLAPCLFFVLCLSSFCLYVILFISLSFLLTLFILLLSLSILNRIMNCSLLIGSIHGVVMHHCTCKYKRSLSLDLVFQPCESISFLTAPVVFYIQSSVPDIIRKLVPEGRHRSLFLK